MSYRIYICAAIILVIGIIAFLANRYMEIYPKKTTAPPSSHVSANSFYAMERWLKETGHSVRVDKKNDLEKIAAAHFAVKSPAVCIIFASVCNWDNADEILRPWIEQGGNLVICIDNIDINENLFNFLSGFGIKAEVCDEFEASWGKTIPDYDREICFIAKETSAAGGHGHTRIAEFFWGEGTLTVTGYPIFMHNRYLERELNARLAWDLTGVRTTDDNKEVLFIRERYISKTLFGKIMERGNIVPLGLSALLLIFIGFWMIVPVFGLVFEEKSKNSRPIRERFAAEIGFLKKHKALNYYLETYERELLPDGGLELDGKRDKYRFKYYNYRDIINNLRSISDGTDRFKHRIGSNKT